MNKFVFAEFFKLLITSRCKPVAFQSHFDIETKTACALWIYSLLLTCNLVSLPVVCLNQNCNNPHVKGTCHLEVDRRN